MIGKHLQARREFVRSLAAQFFECFRREGEPRMWVGPQERALAVNPMALLLGKQLGVAAGTPTGHGDANRTV